MIDVNKLLAKHSSNYKYALEVNRQNNSLISGKDIKPFLKEYTELLLKEAADKAKINSQYFSDEDWGITKVREIVRTHDLCSERTDRDGDLYGVDTYEIDKKSITSIINDINFD